jgi:hypothetical protein
MKKPLKAQEALFFGKAKQSPAFQFTQASGPVFATLS